MHAMGAARRAQCYFQKDQEMTQPACRHDGTDRTKIEWVESDDGTRRIVCTCQVCWHVSEGPEHECEPADDRVPVSRIVLGIGAVCGALAALAVLRDTGPAATGFGLAGIALAIAAVLIRRGYWSCR
jgi:small-conductance mechanosensitive channel